MEMKLVIDTNAYVAFCKNDPKIVLAIQEAESILMPFIVLAELRTGFACGKKSAQNETVLTRFLNSSRVEILYPDEQTTHHYARLFSQLKKQGTPIPTNDLWISSLVLQHDACLLSLDAHFDHLPQILRA